MKLFATYLKPLIWTIIFMATSQNLSAYNFQTDIKPEDVKNEIQDLKDANPHWVEIDANTGQTLNQSGEFPNGARIKIILVNLNPFLYSYSFSITSKDIEQSVINVFLGLIDFSFLKKPDDSSNKDNIETSTSFNAQCNEIQKIQENLNNIINQSTFIENTNTKMKEVIKYINLINNNQIPNSEIPTSKLIKNLKYLTNTDSLNNQYSLLKKELETIETEANKTNALVCPKMRKELIESISNYLGLAKANLESLNLN